MMSVEYSADLMIRLTCFHLVFDQPNEDDRCNLLGYYVIHVVGQII